VLGLIFQTSYFICANEQIVGYKVPSFPWNLKLSKLNSMHLEFGRLISATNFL
jgi:hypothetical protein